MPHASRAVLPAADSAPTAGLTVRGEGQGEHLVDAFFEGKRRADVFERRRVFLHFILGDFYEIHAESATQATKE